MKERRNIGFTLIELIVVVAILGLIVTIAYPSYRGFVIQTRRSDAPIALTQIAALQEKFFTQCNTYATNAQMIGGTIAGCTGLGWLAGGLTAEGQYTLAITPGTINSGGTIADGFTATATPTAGQSQVGDGNYRIDSTGLKQWNRKNLGTWVSWTEK